MEIDEPAFRDFKQGSFEDVTIRCEHAQVGLKLGKPGHEIRGIRIFRSQHRQLQFQGSDFDRAWHQLSAPTARPGRLGDYGRDIIAFGMDALKRGNCEVGCSEECQAHS